MSNKFKSIEEVETAVNNFDFSTLEFHKGENKIFLNTESGSMAAWIEDTDTETAERQNPIVWIGNLYKSNAKKGHNPFGDFEKERVESVLGFKY